MAAATSQERILRLAAVFAAAVLLLLARLFELQVLEAERWRTESESLRVRRSSIPYRRGPVFDRTGTVLAEDRSAFDLHFRYRAFRRGNAIGEATHLLALLSDRAVPLGDIASDGTRFARALARISPRHFVGRSSAVRRDAAFYLGRLLAAAGARLLEDRGRLEIAAAAERLSRRILRGASSGGEEPFARRFGVGEEDLAAVLGGGLQGLEELERTCGFPRGSLLAEADRRRAEIEERIAAKGAGADPPRLSDLRRGVEELPVRIAADLPFDGVLRLTLAPARFAGFSAEPATRRALHPDAPVPVLGLVGRPTREELDREARLAEEYRALLRTFDRTEAEERRLRELAGRVGEFEGRADDPRGKNFGVEFLLDGVLRGRRGSRVVSTEGASATLLDEPPVDGRPVTLTIDLELQRAAVQALRDGYGGIADVVGAVVLLDPRSGDVLALATNPTYSEGEFRSAYGALDADPRRPLKHRAADPYYPPAPGSVFKVVVVAAALEEGIVGPEARFECTGSDGRLKCNVQSGHGALDLGAAVEKSCNVAFYKLGERLGSERLARWARAFGFGERTGIEIAEIAGTVREDLTDGDSARRFAIGQTTIDASPLQVARMMAAIANGGRLLRPRLVARVGEASPVPGESREVALSPPTLAFLREAMRRVVTSGTARSDGVFDLAALGAAGKTGTAEVGKDIPDHSWFAGFAPADDPRIVVVVYGERTGRHGGDLAAPIAERVLRAASERGYLARESPGRVR